MALSLSSLRVSHDSPRTPYVHISGPRCFKHHQNSTETPQERRKNENCGGRSNFEPPFLQVPCSQTPTRCSRPAETQRWHRPCPCEGVADTDKMMLLRRRWTSKKREMANLTISGDPLCTAGPLWPREGTLCRCWWAVREIELLAARCLQVKFLGGPGCGRCFFDLPRVQDRPASGGEEDSHVCLVPRCCGK